MSTCSFSSYLQMRAAAAFSGPAGSGDAPATASGPTSALAPVAVPHHHPHPFDHIAPSPSLSDAGSPFKRQRNRSPDSSNVAAAVASALPTPAATDDGHMSANAVAAASSYFAAFHASHHHHFQQHHAPPMSGLDPPTPSSSSPAHSPLVAPVPKSILCIPSSPLRCDEAPPDASFTRPRKLTCRVFPFSQHPLVLTFHLASGLSPRLAPFVDVQVGSLRTVYERERLSNALNRRVRPIADRPDVRVGES